MPQQIDVPGQGVIEFPDSMSDDQIRDTIKRKFYAEPLSYAVSAPTQATQTLTQTMAAGAEGSAMGREQLGTMRQALSVAAQVPVEAAQKMQRTVDIVKASRDQQIDEEAFLKAIGQEGQPAQNALIRAARNWQMAGTAAAQGETSKTPVDIGGTKVVSGEGAQLPTFFPPAEAGMTEKIAAGLWNVGASIPNFMLSTEGLMAMIAPEALPAEYAGPLLKGLFAGLMAKGTGEAAGKASVTGDPQDITETLGSAVMTGLIGYSGALDALNERRGKLGMDPIKPPVKDLIRSLIQKIAPDSTADKIQAVAPATAAALKEGETDAIQRETTKVLQPVREQPREGAGQVPAQGAGAEAGARSEQALPKETQALTDYQRYQQLVLEVRGKSLDEAFALNKEIEGIKARYGGHAPPGPEFITHATYTDETGVPHVGANHPEILERLGIEGFETRESRNTKEFGFRTNQGRFISRVEAGEVAKAAGQNLEDFDPGEKVHSDQIRSPVQPDQALGDVPAQAPVQPALAPTEGMGGAKLGEIPETGEGGEKYGIAQRVREERAAAGQVDPVEPGRGVDVADSIERGRQINTGDPAAPERFMQQFESDPNGGTSEAMIASLRAHGESLARVARRAEEQFGTDSPEYQSARDALSAWDKRTKPVQTSWGNQGRAQQSWTDLDTGSVAGLERERRRLSDQDFDQSEKDQAGKLAKDVREKETQTDKAAKAVNEELEKNASPERKAQADQQQVADATKAANEAADQVAQAENKIRESQDIIEATRKALAAASKTVRDAAARAAEAENKARIAQAQRDLDIAKNQRKAAQKTQDKINKVLRAKAVEAAKSERVVQERQRLDDQSKAEQAALSSAMKTVRDWAARRAELENKARLAQVGRDKELADIQAKAARKAEEAAWKAVRDSARRQAALQRKILGDASIPVWEKARQYLDKGIVNFDDLRTKVAADLGMSTEKVTRLLARSKRMKYLTDDLWIKQQRERNAKTKAKLWVQGLDMPAYEKFINSLPRVMFKIRVGFHGTVALGTHAPAVAFDPRFWGTYIRNFGKMYKFVLRPSFYQGQMQDLLRRKNYATALRAGLVVDPYKYEEFDRPGITTNASHAISEAMTKALGFDHTAFTKSGERGYAILKVLRQDMFDQHWDNLPRQMQTPEVAQAIAKAVNHVTGVVNAPAPRGAELALFAPKLQMSRAAFLFGDPIRAARTGIRMGVRAAGQALGAKPSQLPFVTPADRYFAVNEVKSKVYMLGTLGSLLAINQGLLIASGSKQRVNMTDMFKSDFGKFKVAGLNVSYGNPLITMARLPLRLGTLASGPGGKLRKLVYPDEDAARMAWEYFRSQLSPFAALTADQVFREDWQRRQLYSSERPEPKRLLAQGIEPYTPSEYWVQQALPIPFQELVRESLREGFGVKPVLSTAFMALTGGRVSEDLEVEHPQ